MARAAGNRGNAMLTGNGGKLFICIVDLFVLNCCGMGLCVYAKQDISIQPIQRYNKFIFFIQKYLSGLS